MKKIYIVYGFVNNKGAYNLSVWDDILLANNEKERIEKRRNPFDLIDIEEYKLNNSYLKAKNEV